MKAKLDQTYNMTTIIICKLSPTIHDYLTTLSFFSASRLQTDLKVFPEINVPVVYKHADVFNMAGEWADVDHEQDEVQVHLMEVCRLSF